MRYFFIGIKGAGMSALASILKKQGHEVAGADTNRFIFTETNLRNLGIVIKDFGEESYETIDLVIVGSSFLNSEEVQKAQSKKLRIVEYHEMLSLLIKDYYSVAVAGTHGKTTTTSLVFNMLNNSFPTSCLIGDGTGQYTNNSKHFVFEACEYKDHFLSYYPTIGIVNNVDYDHTDFFKTIEDYRQAFEKFAKNCQHLVVNGDSYRFLHKSMLTFGIESECDVMAKNINLSTSGINFQLYFKNQYIQDVTFPVYGKHMVYNVLAAISVGFLMGLDINKVINGIGNFRGVGRRFKEKIVKDDVYIDDYAHHPTAIEVTIAAVKSKYPGREIVAVFQPDRYSRIKQFAKEIADSLSKADKAYLLEFPVATNKENLDIDASIITLYNSKIIYLKDQELYEQIKQKYPAVYLIMSSKDQSKLLEKLIDISKEKG